MSNNPYEQYKNNLEYRTKLMANCILEYKTVAKILFIAYSKYDFSIIENLCDNCVACIKKSKQDFTEFIYEIRHLFGMFYSSGIKFTIITTPEYLACSDLLEEKIPELKIHKTETYQCLEAAKEAIAKNKEIISLIRKMQAKELWFNLAELPETLEFEYRYPNGANGDALKFVLQEYGETEPKNSTTWVGRISKDNIEYLEIFAASCDYMSWDARFLYIYDYHLPTLLHRQKNKIAFCGPGSHEITSEILDILKQQKAEQKEARTKLYSQLMLQNKVTPRWKCEAQLFSIASSLYPDAIYQYRAPWLRFQSLDIFIPSISTAIEYQGVQHYKPIDYFGGEEHFKQQQANDRKKKKLCKENGVKLIEWSWEERIEEDLFKQKIAMFDNK